MLQVSKHTYETLKNANQQANNTIEDANRQAQEIVEGAEFFLNTAKEEEYKIKEQAENDAATVIHKAFIEKEHIENEAETIRNQAYDEAENITTAAKQEAADIVDEAFKDNCNLRAENKSLTEENENLKNDIQSNRKQIMILINVIANMPKEKKSIQDWFKKRGAEKYEMDKEAYDGFMSSVDTMKRLSDNTLTSDEDKKSIEERLRHIEQLEADKVRNIREQAEQLGRQMVQRVIDELNAEKDNYKALIKKQKNIIYSIANNMVEKMSGTYARMDRAHRKKELDNAYWQVRNVQRIREEAGMEMEE